MNLYDTEIKIKSVIIAFILAIYYSLIIKFPPYKSSELSKIDKHSIRACFITVLLGLFAYKNIYPGFVYFSYTLIIITNFLFFYIMIKEFSKSNFIEEKIEKVKILLLKFIPCCNKFIKLNKSYKYRVLWRKALNWSLK